jgi:hypothetical protein
MIIYNKDAGQRFLTVGATKAGGSGAGSQANCCAP